MKEHVAGDGVVGGDVDARVQSSVCEKPPLDQAMCHAWAILPARFLHSNPISGFGCSAESFVCSFPFLFSVISRGVHALTPCCVFSSRVHKVIDARG